MSREPNRKDGTVKTQETTESKDGSKVETASEVKPNGDFETKTVTTDKDGKTKEVVETKSTDEAGIVTETKDTIKANGTSTEQTVVTQPDGDYKSVPVSRRNDLTDSEEDLMIKDQIE